MGAREVIELPQAYIEVEARPGYLFVVETGQLVRLSEVKRYTARLDAMARRLERTKALIDARGEIGDPPDDVRDAMWHWLTGPDRPFEFVAFVLPTEMAVARVNMTALSKRAPLRAFDTVQAAQRWLLRDPKLSTANTQPRVSSAPPEVERKTEPRRSRPSPGRYRSTDAPADHVRSSEFVSPETRRSDSDRSERRSDVVRTDVVTPPGGVSRKSSKGSGTGTGTGGSQVA